MNEIKNTIQLNCYQLKQIADAYLDDDLYEPTQEIVLFYYGDNKELAVYDLEYPEENCIIIPEDESNQQRFNIDKEMGDEWGN